MVEDLVQVGVPDVLGDAFGADEARLPQLLGEADGFAEGQGAVGFEPVVLPPDGLLGISQRILVALCQELAGLPDGLDPNGPYFAAEPLGSGQIVDGVFLVSADIEFHMKPLYTIRLRKATFTFIRFDKKKNRSALNVCPILHIDFHLFLLKTRWFLSTTSLM